MNWKALILGIFTVWRNDWNDSWKCSTFLINRQRTPI